MSEVEPTVLVVEDDTQLRRMLKTSLPAHGYRVVDAATGEDAIRLAKEREPDLVLLDLALPGIGGMEVARRLRQWSAVPIIVLSARGQEQSKVDLLDAGADDYVTKPFGFEELLARMRAAMRRGEQRGQAEGALFRCGPLTIDRAERRVWLDDEEVHLTPTEYDLLAVLARYAGRTVTHRQLLESVWSSHSAEAAGRVRVYMTYLRRKIEPDPVHPRILTTQTGVGYRLNCDQAATSSSQASPATRAG
jgi:two-component system KDP operon response regulator KdpE